MSNLNRKGKNVFDHSLTVRRGSIVIDQGGVSGSATSTGSFGQLDAKSISTTTATLISGSFNASAISASFALTKAVTGSFALKKAVTGSFALKKAVSGSFPLKTAISGSFTELSTSLASRIAAEEAEAEGTVVSSSAQIATDISGSLGTNATLIRSLTATGISGSFISVSSSLASRIAAEEAEAEGTVVSSSAQIAIDISGSLGANATLIRGLTTGKISGSLGANATLIRGLTTGKISGSLGANATLIRSLTAAGISGSVVAGVSGSAVSTGSFGKLEVGGNSTLTGKLTVGGRITAQEFHTEFVSSSIVFQSGSTKFGDSATDTHTFTGQLEVSGSQAKVSASVGSTGSFGSIYVDKNVNASAFVGDGSSLTGIDIPTAAAISGSVASGFEFDGSISGSSTSTGSFGHVSVAGVLKTGDIELENKRGHWRIVEESEYLSIHNVKHDKKYKFVLQEIE